MHRQLLSFLCPGVLWPLVVRQDASGAAGGGGESLVTTSVTRKDGSRHTHYHSLTADACTHTVTHADTLVTDEDDGERELVRECESLFLPLESQAVVESSSQESGLVFLESSRSLSSLVSQRRMRRKIRITGRKTREKSDCVCDCRRRQVYI